MYHIGCQMLTPVLGVNSGESTLYLRDSVLEIFFSLFYFIALFVCPSPTR